RSTAATSTLSLHDALPISRKAKARATARQRWEAGAARPEAVPPDDLTWSEVRSALDDELSRLPDKWRLPLVLCFLEGQTQDEARSEEHTSELQSRFDVVCR